MVLMKQLVALLMLTAALDVSHAVAQVQGSGDLVFDPVLGQYLSLAPEEPGVIGGDGAVLVGEGPLLGFEPPQSDCDPLDPSWWGPAWVHRFSVFAGLHGFKGPSDLGRNGNFGFHEGFNYGARLPGPFDWGYQLGLQATHSNFKGDRVFERDSGVRRQIFLTAGVFHRVMDFGLQSGMVFDFYHDEYYDKADLKQIRSETSLRLGELREIGYWGAYNVGGDEVHLTNWITQPLRPEDLFALFYRRHFTGGGQGRAWIGLSGHGDVIFGAEATVPLGTNWALENNFAYLMPEEGSGAGGQSEEVWAISFQLVWYPGRPARCVFRDPYQPMLSVADNSVFMVERD